MSTNALIQITQGATVGTAGQAVVGSSSGGNVTVSAAYPVAGTTYRFELIAVPPGCTLTGGQKVQSGSGSSFVFSPASAKGTYRIMLEQWGADGSYDKDIRCFGAPFPGGVLPPPYQGNHAPISLDLKPGECNFGGATDEWAGTISGAKSVYQALVDLDSIIQGIGTTPTPVPAPGTAGNVLQSNGTAWTQQAFFRTPAAAALGGASGFIRATESDVIVTTRMSGVDYAVLQFYADGSGGGPILGSSSLFRTTLRASNYVQFEVGGATYVFSTTGWDIGGLKLTTLGTPTASTDAATKGYVDARLCIMPARVVSTSNITQSGTMTIDGVSLVAGDVVLCTQQTGGVTNGLWVVAAGAWSRHALLPAGSGSSGTVFAIRKGTVGAHQIWIGVDEPGSDVVGTSALTFQHAT